MDIDRLKMWRDALLHANQIGRVFNIRSWIGSGKGCGFTACAVGDLALYGPAQDLGWRANTDRNLVAFNNAGGSCGVEDFLKIDFRSADDSAWVAETISGDNIGGVYVGKSGKPLAPWNITRDMVLARINAKIAELETA